MTIIMELLNSFKLIMSDTARSIILLVACMIIKNGPCMGGGGGGGGVLYNLVPLNCS